MNFSNVTADAVNTIEWVSAANTTIAVPVYQRQCRWEIDGCQQLLEDIRAVAAGDARQTHFIGSIRVAPSSHSHSCREIIAPPDLSAERICPARRLLA